MPKYITVRTLSDQPVDADAFGSHDRIADALVKIIDLEPGGKSIALTGAWGSGKSTVIQLLRRRLLSLNGAKTMSTLIFEFDAWAHEGDSLRRAFLEALGSALRNASWISEEYWEQKRWHLSTKEDQTVTSSKPNPTVWGVSLSMSLLLVPLGYALVKFLDSNSSIWKQSVLYAICGCIAAPVFIAALAWLVGKRSLPQVTTIFGTKQAQPVSFADVFLDNRHSLTESTTVRGPDPTSVEFEQIYADIAATALALPNRRLCIVIDNLDRLEPAGVITVWSTLGVFFARSAGQDSTFIERFWIIAAFDQLILHRRLKQEGGPPLEGLLAKTFDLAFRVPEPPLASWREYLNRCLLEAFPDLSDRDIFDDLAYAFDRLRPNHEPVTPRQLKKFVNRLGVSVRQWGDEIPLLTQAVYVLNHANDANAISHLQQANFLPPGIRAMLSASAREDMVRLHFVIDSDRAAYLLWGDRIRASIRDGQVPVIAELLETAGFRLVLQQLLADDSITPRISAVSEHIRFLTILEEAAPNFNAEFFWRQLQALFNDEIEWDIANRLVSKSVKVIVERSQGAVCQPLFKGLASATHENGSVSERRLGLLWIVKTLSRDVPSAFRDLSLPFGSRFNLSIPPKNLIEYIGDSKWMDELGNRPMNFFQISPQTAAEVIDYLAKVIKDLKVPAGAALTVSVLESLMAGRTEWTPLIEAVRERIESVDVKWSPDNPALLRVFLALARYDRLSVPLKTIWRFTALSCASDHADTHQTAESVRIAILVSSSRFVQSEPNYNSDDVDWLYSLSDSILDSIVSNLVRGEDAHSISDALEKHGALSHLRTLVLRKAVDLGWLTWLWIDADKFLESPKVYLAILGSKRFRAAAQELRKHMLDWSHNGQFSIEYRLHCFSNGLLLEHQRDNATWQTERLEKAGHLLDSSEKSQSSAAVTRADLAHDNSALGDSLPAIQAGDDDCEPGNLNSEADDDGFETDDGPEDVRTSKRNPRDLLTLYVHHLVGTGANVQPRANEDALRCLNALESDQEDEFLDDVINVAIESTSPIDNLLKAFGASMAMRLAGSAKSHEILIAMARRFRTPSELEWLSGAVDGASTDIVRNLILTLSNRTATEESQENRAKDDLLKVLRARTG